MTEPKVFVEDEGTGLAEQVDADILDAAHLGALAHVPNAGDVAVEPPTLTTDYGVPEVDLSEAQYRITGENITSRERDGTETTWPEATIVVKMPSETVQLDADTENSIFVDVDLEDGPDSVEYVQNTSGDAPSDTSLLVATIDTDAEESTVENINPEGTFESLSAVDEVNVQGADDGYKVEYLGTYQTENDLPDGDNPAFAFVIDDDKFATRGI